MKKDRRQFLKTAGLTTAASSLPFLQLLVGNNHLQESDKDGFVVDAEVQETYLIAGRKAPVTIIVDKEKKAYRQSHFVMKI